MPHPQPPDGAPPARPCASATAVRWIGIAAILGLVLGGAVTGCSTMGYYWQAFDGQMALNSQSRPIPEVIQDPKTGAELKARLEQVREIREFASRQLDLPDNGSYRRYADLKRRYVVWNVFAAPEFSVEPREWCFPIAGCVGYRGYFEEAQASEFAAGLGQEGLDVYIAGVPAYSTLGWFDDPVLNTFVNYPDTDLARLIFHELSHQVAYAPGDSTFNESFATTVETEGVERWIGQHGTPAQRDAFQASQRRRAQFAELVTSYRERFAAAYAEAGSDDARLAAKRRLQEQMRTDYARLKESWGGYAGYDWWFAQPLNNAQLASVALYTQLVPAFEKLLDACARNLPCFYARVKELARLPEAERRAQLQEALGEGVKREG